MPRDTIMPAIVEIVEHVDRLGAEIDRLARENAALREQVDAQYRRGYSAGHTAAGRGRHRLGPSTVGRPRLHLVERPVVVEPELVIA